MRFTHRYALAVLLALPFVYFGMLLATAVHEFIGHGLVTLAVGGSFTGVQLQFDGSGCAWFAFEPRRAEPWKLIAIRLGGVVSTIVVGLILLILSFRTRRSPCLALPLVALAANHLLEGPPYLFWNALHPLPPGDIGPIVATRPPARAACIAVGGTLMLATIWLCTALVLWVAESWLNDGQRLEGRRRLALLATIAGLGGAAWFVGDWDQLAPGLGIWPSLVGLLLHVLAAASLWRTRWHLDPVPFSVRNALTSLAAGWGMATAAVLVIALWLRDGLYW